MAKTILHHVCVGGVQVGETVDSVEAAEKAMSMLAMDGVSGRSLTVETYEYDDETRTVSDALPYYANGRWHDSFRKALPKAA